MTRVVESSIGPAAARTLLPHRLHCVRGPPRTASTARGPHQPRLSPAPPSSDPPTAPSYAFPSHFLMVVALLFHGFLLRLPRVDIGRCLPLVSTPPVFPPSLAGPPSSPNRARAAASPTLVAFLCLAVLPGLGWFCCFACSVLRFLIPVHLLFVPDSVPVISRWSASWTDCHR